MCVSVKVCVYNKGIVYKLPKKLVYEREYFVSELIRSIKCGVLYYLQ